MINPTNIVLYSAVTLPVIGNFVAKFAFNNCQEQIKKIENGSAENKVQLTDKVTHLRNLQIAALARNVIFIAMLVAFVATALLSPLATIILGIFFLDAVSDNIKALISTNNRLEELAAK